MFEFSLNAEVRLLHLGEIGRVIGRSEFTSRPPEYLVHYIGGHQRAVQVWFAAAALRKQQQD